MKLMLVTPLVYLCVHQVVLSSASHDPSRFTTPLAEIQILEHRSQQNLRTGAVHSREKRKIYYFPNHSSKKWPNPINYMLSAQFNREQKNIIEDVLREDFEQRTCIRFNKITSVAQSGETQFIHFQKQGPLEASACKAYIGEEEDIRTFHGQPIYLGSSCFSLRGQLIHMIAATLGMFNEVQRHDRDQYVDIFMDNIQDAGRSNFGRQSNDTVYTHNVPYDYGSAMHYRSKAWLKPQYVNVDGKYSVLPKDRSLTHLLGQVSEISFYDVQVLNHAYCDTYCSSARSCLNGGYQDPNECTKCLCPDGYHGDSCESVSVGSGQCRPASGTIDATVAEQCVSSPGYESGDSYTLGDSCTWLITAPPGRLIDMYFYESVFSLPYLASDSDICIHWVEIKHKGIEATRGARYCSKDNRSLNPTMPTANKQLTSEASQVLVLFRAPKAHMTTTYLSDSLKGFKLCFKISDTTLAMPTLTSTPRPASRSTAGVAITSTTNQASNPQTTIAQIPISKPQPHAVQHHESGLSTTTIGIVVVVVALLLLLLVFAAVIIVMLCRKRRKRPEPVVVASGMNNPGYDVHEFPQVSINPGPDPALEKKLAAALGAVNIGNDADLPPKYEDVPPGVAPPYTISNDYKNYVNTPAPLSQRPLPSEPEPDYEIPAPIGGHVGRVPLSQRPIPALPDQDSTDEVIYQNAGGVKNMMRRFEK